MPPENRANPAQRTKGKWIREMGSAEGCASIQGKAHRNKSDPVMLINGRIRWLRTSVVVSMLKRNAPAITKSPAARRSVAKGRAGSAQNSDNLHKPQAISRTAV